MPELNVERGCLYYETHGEGPPLVGIRGLGQSIPHWLGYGQTLARHYQVVLVDLRGAGRTTVPAGLGDTVFDLGGDMIRVLDHLGIESAHFLGISLGGMVALAAGLDHAARCRSLAVVNTSIAGARSMRLTPRALWTGVSGRLLFRRTFQHRLVELLVGPTATAELKASIAREYARIDASAGKTALVLRQLGAAARFKIKRRLSDLDVPTLVVYGTHDRFVSNVNSTKLYDLLPKAKLVPIQDAGHEPSLDKPSELLEVLQAWTAENGGVV